MMYTIDGARSGLDAQRPTRPQHDTRTHDAQVRDTRGEPTLSDRLGDRARDTTSTDGRSLYDARSDIMAALSNAMRSSDGKGDARDALDTALRDAGFDPAAIRDAMTRPNDRSKPSDLGPLLSDAGSNRARVTDLAELRDLAEHNPTLAADVLINDLLAQLPTGSTIDRRV